MSITGSDQAPALVPEPGLGEPDHTDLIARFISEAWSKSSGAAPPPSVPVAAPGRVPEFALPPASALAGAGRATPPVHPVSQREAPRTAPEAPVSTRSPVPQQEETHPFGEPRSDIAWFRGRREPVAKTTNSNPLAELSRGESITSADYYFLRQSDAPGKSPRAATTYPQSAPPVPAFDLEGVRRDFPALHQLIHGRPLVWLDNAATTHKPQSVIDATSQFYSRDNSNIHRAAHTLAARATDLFEAGREKAREFLGAADAKEIIFCRGTTEAINLVAQTYGRKNIGAGDEIILTELEHHANIVPWQLLAEQTGAVIRVIPINDRGELILEEFVKLLGPKTKFISVAHVSNSLGTVNPVEQIIALARPLGVPVLVDGAQSTPHLPVNVTALDADFYVFSGHKVFGPTGIGVLYGKASHLESMPPWQGGGHMIRDVRFEKTVYQDAPQKFEAGTPDIAGVVGLGAAIDYLHKIGLPAIAAYEHALLEYATQAVATIPGLRPIGTAANKASVFAFVISEIPNAKIARHLDNHGIAVRAGHHCAQPAQRHFGLEGTVRPSLAFYNTREEVDALVRALRSLRPHH